MVVVVAECTVHAESHTALECASMVAMLTMNVNYSKTDLLALR